jgi:predicted ATP-dependent serine protease
MIAVGYRPAAELVPTVDGMSAKALAALDQKTFDLAPALDGVKVAGDAFLCGYGGPGAGKTTAGLLVAERLQPSVFLAFETGLGPALGERLRQLEIRADRLWIEKPRSVSRAMELATSVGLRCIVVDSGSVCSLLPADWLAVARSNKILVFVLLQVTKEGLHAGSNSWIHDPDVVLEIESLSFRVIKSRFQPAGLTGRISA